MDESEQERIDRYARKMVDTVTTIAGKGAAFALKLLVVVTIVCVGGFALGVAALSDGIETLWIVLGVTFGAIAIGSALVALWRVGRVRHRAPRLANEVRTLVATDPDGRFVETFVVDETANGPDGPGGSTIVLSRQMGGVRDRFGPRLADTPELDGALRAVTSFPLLVIIAIPITFVFAFFGIIFLIALAL